MIQFQTVEFTYHGENLKQNYSSINLTCHITGAEEKVIKGFYDGNGTYKIRFFPAKVGVYHFSVEGIFNDNFSLQCEKGNLHGKVNAVETHFEYDDKSLFFPFGTTVYGFFHQNNKLENKTIKTLKNGYFNKIRLCVFPKYYEFNENDPIYFPFNLKNGQFDVDTPNIEFFHHFEKRLNQLFDMNMQVDLILFHPYDKWGFRKMGLKNNLKYLDYLLARFSAYPNIWWSLANEYDLLLNDISMEDWYEIEEFVANNDPYHHLISNHQCFLPYDWNRKNITHICTQTKNIANVSHLIETINKPAIIDECCYEGDIENYWGSISAKEMVYRFYRSIANGAYCTHGETFYNDDEILFWSKGGRLKGKSAPRIKYLKNIVENLKSPLIAIPPFINGLLLKSKEELLASLPYVPDQYKELTKALAEISCLMTLEQKIQHSDLEKEWNAKSEDDSTFFTFLDLRTCKTLHYNLPSNASYKIELIDVWNMKRSTLVECASGRTKLTLPGKEGFCILATRI